MKKLLVFFWLVPVVVFARDVYLTNPSVPYEVIMIETTMTESQLHLGELDNFPIMYEFVVTEETNFQASLAQPAQGTETANPLTLMLVRKDDRGGGVSEVSRLIPDSSTWSTIKDASLGVTLLEGGGLNEELAPGTYRLEVSTPDNFGKYLLSLGPQDSGGYFATLSEAWQVQQFLGYSPIKILTSSLVYYPLGILILAFLIHRTWKYRKFIKHVS
jgi:hypothetical protein